MGNGLEFRGRLRDVAPVPLVAVAAMVVAAVVALGLLPDESRIEDVDFAVRPSPSQIAAKAGSAAASPSPGIAMPVFDQIIEDYVAQVRAICLKADGRFRSGGSFDHPLLYLQAAVRNADEALAELRELTPPDVIRPELVEVVVYLEAPIDVLRFVIWAEANAAPGVAATALEERVAVTHWRDGRFQDLGERWVARWGAGAGELSPTFQNCPLRLGA